MQVTQRTDNCLALHEGPWAFRGLGAILAGLGFGALFAVLDGHGHEHNAWVGVVVGSLFGIIGLGMEIGASDRRVVIDKSAGSVRMEWRRLFGTTRRTLAMADIQDIALERSLGPQSGSAATWCYRMTFILKDGSRVPWTRVLTGDYGTQATCVAAVRSFAGWNALAAAEPPRGVTTATQVASIPPRRRNILIAIPLLFSLLGFYLLGLEAYRFHAWRPVTATIVSTGIATETSSRNGSSYRPTLVYRYGPDDAPIIASGATVLSLAASYQWADGIITTYPRGATVTARINPANRTQGFVDPRMLWFPLVFVSVPSILIVIFAYSDHWTRRQVALTTDLRVPLLD